MESDIFVGARVRLSNIKTLDYDPRISVTHKPPKGKVFVAIIVGVEDKSPTAVEDLVSGDAVRQILSDLETPNESPDPIPGCTISSATGVV